MQRYPYRPAQNATSPRIQIINDLNRAMPTGRNYWFHLQSEARRAAIMTAKQMSQRTGKRFIVEHHVYQPFGLRHYHISTLDDRPLAIRFMYLEVLPGEIETYEGPVAQSYQTARQKFLRALMDDQNQPSFIRGWIKQELNRLTRIYQIKNTSRCHNDGNKMMNCPPGGSKRIKGIHGFDVGHRIPGLHTPANFRIEHASTNRARPSIARRLGIKKYR